MFRMWAKIWMGNRLIRDMVICREEADTRTHKVFAALEEACLGLDLSRPIWLDSTIADFKKHGRTRFTQDNFIDTIDFDFLEIHIIEED